MIDFIVSHKMAFELFAIAVIDFAFAMSPALKSNGILHFIYLTIGGKANA